MELIPYSGGGILEPSIDQVNEFVPNPQSCWITKLESGDVELSFLEGGVIQLLTLAPRAQVRVTRLLLDCLRNLGFVV